MNQITNLEEKIKIARDAYYNSSSIISDEEYDDLLEQLFILDPNNNIFVEVGFEATSKEWKKEKHLFPLGSLNKVNSPIEMKNWIEKNCSDKEILILEKLDGLSVGLQYENGTLIKSILRGGGYEGEDIYKNCIKMQGVNKNLKKSFTGIIRAEIIMKKDFHTKNFINYSNPRNACSGVCRRSDGEGSEFLTIMAYDVLSDKTNFNLELDKLDFLKENDFIIPNFKLCVNADEVNLLWNEYQQVTRNSLNYEIDGLVAVINDIDLQNQLGEINLRPRGKVAFKFDRQYAEGKISNIILGCGSTGRIVPVAVFNPKVNLMGTDIEKATLHNFSNVQRLGVGIGATVKITRAGDVIPFVKEVIIPPKLILEAPKQCPSCNTNTIFDGEYLLCPNTLDCQAQTAGRIENWFTKLNILEWGSALIERLVESKKVITVADLYKLSVDDLANIERMGEKSAKKCHKLLWDYTEIPLDILVGSLSIPSIGRSMMKLLVEAGFDTLDKLKTASESDFAKVKGFGHKRAELLVRGLKKNSNMLDELLSLGIKVKEKTIGKLSGNKICITGSTSIKRAEWEKIISDNGGVNKSSVGKDCTYLMIADVNSTSSKAVSARKLGVKLATENDIYRMIYGKDM